MSDFFLNLFNSEGFTPKRVAGTSWNSSLVYLDIFAHLIIIVAFLSIPVSLYYLKATKIDRLIKPQIYSLFYWFSILCAISRCSSVFVYFWPVNRFYIVLDYCCAFSVCRLAWKLRTAIEYLINLPPLSVIQEINVKQEKELLDQKVAQEKLQGEVVALNDVVLNLEDILKRELWVYDRQGTLNALQKMLDQLGKNSHEP